LGFGSFIGEFVDDATSSLQPIVEQADFTQSWQEHPLDVLSLTPVVGAPFAYHQFREGRSSLSGTIASLGIGLVTTEAAWYAARRYGISVTSSELMLARGLHTAGLRFGGRSYLGYALFGARTAAGLGWSIPLWATALLMYEYQRWFVGKVTQPRSDSDYAIKTRQRNL